MADRIVSPNGAHALIVQDDGNLVLYQHGTPVWATNTVVEPDPLPPTPPPQTGAFRLQGRFLLKGPSVYRWKGITGFALLELLAHGQEAQARAWATARRAEGFNLVRTLGMCSWLNLGPVEGRARLPQLLALLADTGLALELVALSDTKAFGFTLEDCREQVNALAALVAPTPHALLQVANEHYHPTQIDALHDPTVIDRLVVEAPALAAILTGSAAASDEALVPAGEYVTRHLDRSRDLWNMVRRVRELENVSRELGCYVVNDEPIGAGEVEEPGRRCTDPAIFFTFGVLGRIFEVGSTFHCEAGLRCDPLGPVQRDCARAFLHGCTVIPESEVLTFKNATWADSPVKAFDTTAAVRVYSGVTGDRGWTCALGLTGTPKIEWQNGWRPTATVASYPGVVLMSLERV